MVNKVILIGRAGREPDTRKTPSGLTVTKFSLATDRKWKDKDGNWQDETEWHRIVIWGQSAERAAEVITKGKLIYVEGRIHYDNYEDKDGVKKTSTDIIADTYRLLEKREGSGGGDYSQSRKTEPDNFVSQTEDTVSEDDIPF